MLFKLQTGLFLVCLLIPSLRAQHIDVELSEKKMLIDGVATDVITGHVPGTEAELEKLWKGFLRDEYGLKLSKKKDVLFSSEVVINRITDRRGDLILFSYPQENDVYFSLAFKLGYDVFLNASEFPQETENFKSFAQHFIHYYYFHHLSRRIKDLEREISKMKNDFKAAEREVKRIDKELSGSARKLDRNDRKLASFKKKLQKEIDEQKQAEMNARLAALEAENFSVRSEVELMQQARAKEVAILEDIKPRIEGFEEELKNLKLMYLEAKERIKA